MSGLLAGSLAACADKPRPEVPGAPTVDPAGVPPVAAPEPASSPAPAPASSGSKMSCSASMMGNGKNGASAGKPDGG